MWSVYRLLFNTCSIINNFSIQFSISGKIGVSVSILKAEINARRSGAVFILNNTKLKAPLHIFMKPCVYSSLQEILYINNYLKYVFTATTDQFFKIAQKDRNITTMSEEDEQRRKQQYAVNFVSAEFPELSKLNYPKGYLGIVTPV